MMHISFSFGSSSSTTWIVCVTDLWYTGENTHLLSFISVTGKRPNVRVKNDCVLDQKEMFFVPFGTLIDAFFYLLMWEGEENKTKNTQNKIFSTCL